MAKNVRSCDLSDTENTVLEVSHGKCTVALRIRLNYIYWFLTIKKPFTVRKGDFDFNIENQNTF